MANERIESREFQPERRFCMWQRLKSLSWVALISALLWFLLRELRPGFATIGNDAVFPLIAVAGLFLGAMLVGAKLALAPPGRRPTVNDMIALFVAPAFALLLGAWALNHVGGKPDQTFVAPVTGLIKEKGGTRFNYRVQLMGPNGAVEESTLASRVAAKNQPRWDDFAGFRRGACALLNHREGSLGLDIMGDVTPVSCPARHGEAAPDGPVRIVMTSDDMAQWVWHWPEAAQAGGFEDWYRDLRVVARRHTAELDGKTIGLVARLEHDGRISAARLREAKIDPAIANALATTRVDRNVVLLPPDTMRSAGEPVWVTVPLRLTID